MQTALFLTDCSVDSALSLRNWLAEHTRQPLRLTVVHPYEMTGENPLHKSVCKPAKADALARLDNWTAMLGEVDTTYLTTEALFASPNVTLMIHLLIRGYDYWLVEDWTLADSPSVAALREQTSTKVRVLGEQVGAVFRPTSRLPATGSP